MSGNVRSLNLVFHWKFSDIWGTGSSDHRVSLKVQWYVRWGTSLYIGCHWKSSDIWGLGIGMVWMKLGVQWTVNGHMWYEVDMNLGVHWQFSDIWGSGEVWTYGYTESLVSSGVHGGMNLWFHWKFSDIWCLGRYEHRVSLKVQGRHVPRVSLKVQWHMRFGDVWTEVQEIII